MPADLAQGAQEPATMLWTQVDPPQPRDGRPAVVGMMVSSVDGHVTESGRVGGLTGPADQAMLHELRSRSDAVLVGATTIRVEGYAGLLSEQERSRRTAIGKDPQPLLGIVSARGALSPDLPVFRASDLRVAVLTSTDADVSSLPREVEVLRADRDDAGELDISHLLSDLHSKYGVTQVTCEGGPTLLGSLVRNAVLDELILVMSPRISGGDGLRIITGARVIPKKLELIASATSGGFAFHRYRVAE
jgi:riboflavin biosynthesis pyrimidine reductase